MGLLDGLTVPMVTPMSAPGEPSARAGKPLLRAFAAAGVTRLMLLGSNGEGPLIRADRTGPFVRDVTRLWRGLVPGGQILANVTAPGTGEALWRAELAGEVDAYVLSPPTYFAHREDEVVAHYRALAALGVPVIAYNAPKYATPLTAASAEAVADVPGVAGVKDSSGDPALLAHLVSLSRTRPGFEVSQGAEGALAAGLRAGAHGIVPGTANLAPRLALDMLAAHRCGDDALLDRLQGLTERLTRIHAVRPGVPSVKAILAARGLCPVHSAPPLAPCTDAQIRELDGVIEPLGDAILPKEDAHDRPEAAT
ncbi:dihydrodipicolinate synthase family protein [Phytomonospora endophytica]|uniref:4-hydroxy-tetrahydrodipicolinate synthase n=1 Tax=Phytomonospora endophytica TaxID=714109 RepID=A0A841FPI1_9ACTN|nr:dihydrodipicolinate synthase family protein [Phytomonospora endophytica]MBB6038006.1 4-hydroxy-tetrahydrodipicolinate synthase [Phytomonospora endophytica]GIG68905.1 dihydrodipicolinate synthase family protein [Phytomonospora endophytica]